jgi:hypothetical protein
MSRAACFTTASLTLLLVIPAPAQPPADASSATQSAKSWVERRAEIEEYLKSAAVTDMEELKVGVTRPKRARLAAGGPVEYIAWKNVPPGRRDGYWESYKSEIAAYELDKLLTLDMVPPTVEKRVQNELGAAVMWCSPTKSFKEMGGVPTPPPAKAAAWVRQLVRAKMFDNLIGNKDPNLGNWLVDPAWNLLLIDHTRAFATDTTLVHKSMDHIDGDLWDRMKALTLEGVTPVLQPWIGRAEIRMIFERRGRMQQQFEKLIAQKGEASVVIR